MRENQTIANPTNRHVKQEQSSDEEDIELSGSVESSHNLPLKEEHHTKPTRILRSSKQTTLAFAPMKVEELPH